MIDLFLSLVISSLVGTIIWLVQTIIRPLTNRVFSQSWHYYTGLIPVFFLLGGSELINRLILLINSPSPSPIMEPITGESVHVHSVEQTASSLSFINQLLNNLLRLEKIDDIVLFVLLIWAAGTIVFLALNILNYWSFRHSVLQKSRVSNTVQCPVKVIISASSTSPMIMGLWKPIIILPNTQLGEEELALILSHELVHIQRNDLFVKLIALVANAIHWFNPAVYVLNKQMNMLCELSCDEKVVQEMDSESRRMYGETLLAMLAYGVMRRNVVFTSSLCNSKENMKRRLINLMNVRKTNKSIIMLSLMATIAILGGGGLVSFAAGSAVPLISLSDGDRNIYVQHPNGTIEYYNQQGNRTLVPHMKKSIYPPVDEVTQKKIDELNEKINSYIQKGLPAPQEYLDEINELYGIIPFGDQ